MGAALLGSGLTTEADVRMPAIFSDHMVLQQGKTVNVWGWAAEGETVTVTFDGQRVITTAQNGKWSVVLKNLSASDAPKTLTIDGINRVAFEDVLVGEVWVCSGQSNMAWQMHQSHEPADVIKNSYNKNLRLFTVERKKSQEPLADLDQPHMGKYGWNVASDQSVHTFSAVAYYFGAALQASLEVPVGLIHTSWGGSPAEAWTSRDALEKSYPEILESYAAQEAAYAKNLAAWNEKVATAKKEKKKVQGSAPRAPWIPSELYNGMIAPLIPYTIKGAIWYQGESNAGRAWQYRSLFPDMIKNWWGNWGQGPFPFLAVQLAPYDKKHSMEEITKEPRTDSTWAVLREAQLLATKDRNVGMAVITDVGEKDDIHPKKKKEVGDRLALAARGIAYKEKITYSGPVYKSMKVRKGQVTLTFNHIGSGLMVKGDKLTGFSIAGEDQKFVWADAVIDGKNVIVSHPSIEKPEAVRFGWADFPIVNLFNEEGLPATPFRTDDWQVETQPKE